MSKKVLLAIDLEPNYVEMYKGEGIDLTVKKAPQVTEADVRDMDIIVGNIKPALIKSATHLELMQLNSAGYDNYLGFVDSKTKLCNCVGAFSPAVGEHILAMTFSLIRHFHLYRDKQNAKDWSDCGKIISVEGSTIGVLGLGDIGKSYAGKVKALGAAKVIGVRRNVKDKPSYVDELYTIEDIDKVLPQCDIVVNVLPSDKTTLNLFNEKTFAMMKKGAYFINVGRGDAVDQDALLKALQSKHLAGAASDVFTPEPLPKDHPLWSEPNFLLTPHVAGWFFLEETKKRIVNISSSNLKAFIKGEPLKNEVEH